MFSLNEQNDIDKTRQETETGETSIVQNGLVSTAWEAIKAAVRFKATKAVMFLLVVPIFLFITGDFEKSVNIADDIATKGANDDYWGLFGAVAREKGHKSTKLNMHPFYHTNNVKKLELDFELKYKYKIKFSKLFSYVIYEKQDFMVMKKQARGKGRQKQKLELSTLFGLSANDFCEDNYDAFIMDAEMKSQVVKTLRVSKIRDELTKDNDDGKKFFRCVIDSDTIEDYLED